jgi:anti-sigma B factor antagonist
MKITQREANDVKIMDFEGNLDTNTSHDAEVELNRMLDQGSSKILINFDKLDYISSAGLRILLATAKRLKSMGGEVRLCHLNETVQEIFDISGFSMILNVFGEESEALEGF